LVYVLPIALIFLNERFERIDYTQVAERVSTGWEIIVCWCGLSVLCYFVRGEGISSG
jgi:hypothetical protein